MSESIFTYDNKYLTSVFAKTNTNALSYFTLPNKLAIVSTLSLLENRSDSPVSIPAFLKTVTISDADTYKYILYYNRRFSSDGGTLGTPPVFGFFNESVARRYRREEEKFGNSLPLGGGGVSFVRSSNLFDNVSSSIAQSLGTNISSLKSSFESNLPGTQTISPQITTAHGFLCMGDVAYPTLISQNNTNVLTSLKTSIPTDIYNFFFSYTSQITIPQRLFTENQEDGTITTVNRLGRRPKIINTESNARLTIDIKQNPAS